MTSSQIPEIACRELVELVTDYLEGRLPPEERARFDVHLAECDGCATYLEQMRQTIRALGRVPEESLSGEARDRLLEAFRDWPRNRTQ
jgi:anti-sigma factor RsiW